jgi:hypothetical protein
MKLFLAASTDALAGRVIFIGDGDQRLKEDYLRILRFLPLQCLVWRRGG